MLCEEDFSKIECSSSSFAMTVAKDDWEVLVECVLELEGDFRDDKLEIK